MPSGRPISNNDPLLRRDAGLEFLNVTSQIRTEISGTGGVLPEVLKITNTSPSTAVDTHLLMVLRGLSGQFTLQNASGLTSKGDPYIRLFLPNGTLDPGQSFSQELVFNRQPSATAGRRYILDFLSGQGNP